MKVTSSPYRVAFSVYGDDGALLSSYTTGETTDSRGNVIPVLHDVNEYSTIKYVVLESWGGPSTYSVDWIKISS
jgi:hypothetical protein